MEKRGSALVVPVDGTGPRPWMPALVVSRVGTAGRSSVGAERDRVSGRASGTPWPGRWWSAS
eukprot:6133046-Prorocentrum_lima.AAC.1